MSNFSILRGMVAYVDNVDGKGADAFAKALLGHPEIGVRLGFVGFETLRDVLIEQGPSLRAIVESHADHITAGLMARFAGKPKGDA